MANKPRVFRPAGAGTPQEAARRADRERGSARSRGYTAEWDRAAAWFKDEHPLCLGCSAVGIYSATEVVDHVVPHGGDRALFWDRDNWQAACAWHHDVVKQRLERMSGRGEVGQGELRLDSRTAIGLTRLLRR